MTNPYEINLEIGNPLPYELVLKGGQIRFPKGQKITADMLKMLREGTVEKIQIGWPSTEENELGLFPEKKIDTETELRLKKTYISKKAKMKISSVLDGFDDPLSLPMEFIKSIWKDQSSGFDTRHIIGKIDEWIDRASGNDAILAGIGWSSEPENYFPSHAIETARLASWLGLKMGFSREEVFTMTLAGIMHDIGELFMDRNMLMKSGNLEQSEMKRLREHPRKSVEWLKRAEIDFENLHKIVLRHHERNDGTGYPYNLNGKVIEKSDSILAIVDVYIALVNPRPYRSAITRRQALRTILEQKGKWFPAELVENFVSNIGIYPPGSLVELSNGNIALILEPPSKGKWRGLVVDLKSENDEFKEVDLNGIEGAYISREIV